MCPPCNHAPENRITSNMGVHTDTKGKIDVIPSVCGSHCSHTDTGSVAHTVANIRDSSRE